MKQYLTNLFSKPETEKTIVVTENTCSCGGKICYNKYSLKELTEQHSEANAFCKECGNDKFRVMVSTGMTTIYHK